MIDEYGIVTKAEDGKLEVRVTAPGSCDSCPIHDNCYASGNVVSVPQQGDFRVNDQVRFSISNASVLKISALVYGLPLIGVLAGIIAGYLLLFRSMADDPRILASVGLGISLFLAAGYIVSRLDRVMKSRLSYDIVRAKFPTTAPEGSSSE